MANENLRNLYNTLKNSGYNPPEFDQFVKDMSDEDNLRKVHATLQSEGYTPPAYDTFKADMAYTAPTTSTPTTSTPEVKTEAQAAAATAKQQHGWQPTEEQQLAFQQQMAQGEANLERIRQQAEDFTEYAQRAGINFGKTVKSTPQWSPATNKFESSYLTPTGERTTNKAMADFASQQYRNSADISISGQLRKAQQRKQDIMRQLAERGEILKAEHRRNEPSGVIGFLKGMAEAGADRMVGKTGENPEEWIELTQDEEYQSLSLALRTVDKQITQLSNAKDKEDHGERFWHDFFRNAGQAIFNVDAWDFGKHVFRDANAAQQLSGRIDRGEELSDADYQAAEELYLYDNVMKAYGDLGRGARWGDISGSSISFMKDFIITGGFGGMTTSVPANLTKGVALRAATKMGADWAGKRLALQFGKEGLFATLRSGSKGTMNQLIKTMGVRGMAQAMTVKAIGVGAEDLLIRAPLMTFTVQGQSTAAKIIDTKLGPVIVDEETGELRFSNDKGWGEAAWEAGMDQITENYSEMWGAHLPGLTNMTKALGARNLTAAILRSTRPGAGTILSKTSNFLSRAGVNGYFGEVGEEYYGQLWRTGLGLESASQPKFNENGNPVYKVDENGESILDEKGNPIQERENNFKSGQFHGDIWGGMALSIGMTGGGTMALNYAGRGVVKGVNAASYNYHKHKVNVADRRASELLTPEVWENARTVIDAADNGTIGDLAELVMTDENINDGQRAAVMDYMEQSMIFRGYNLGEILRDRAGVNPNPSVDDEDELSDSYMDGYSMSTPQEMSDAKNMLNYQRQHLGKFFADEDVELIGQNDPIGMLIYANKEGWDDETKDAVRDYLNAKMVYEGMMQGVRDGIEEQIASSDAMIDSRINGSTGQIHQATMSVDDRKVYVVGGRFALNDDGTVDKDNTDESLIIRDAETGKLDYTDPNAIVSGEEGVDPTKEKAKASETIRQDYAQRAANNIDGVLTVTVGNSYPVTDGNGQVMSATLVGYALDEDGAAITDSYILQMPDGSTAVFSYDQLQAMTEAANLERLNQFEQERQAERQAHREAEREATRPQYNYGDVFTFKVEGNLIHGSVTAAMNEDGLIEVHTEERINGNKVNLFTREELDAMLHEQLHSTADANADHYSTGEVEAEAEGSEQRGVPNPSESVPTSTESSTADTESISETDVQTGPQTETPVESVASIEPQISVLSQIPKDAKGKPNFGAAPTAEIGWDALVEKTEGDEEMARIFADNMVSAKESALKKGEKAKPKVIDDIDEFIESENQRKAAIEQAKAELEMWRKIAAVKEKRQGEAERIREDEIRRKAEEARNREAKEKAEREEVERIEREALEGVPDWAHDTPTNARKRGYRRFNGQKIDRQQPTAQDDKGFGKEVEPMFRAGDKPVSAKGRVFVGNVEDFQPSHLDGKQNAAHFGDEWQPKKRHEDGGVSGHNADANARNLRPELVTRFEDAFGGAPIVNARREGIQGNNRLQMLRYLYERYPEHAKAYKQYLIDHAEDFGVDADYIRSLERPIVTMMLDVTDDEANRYGNIDDKEMTSGGKEELRPKNIVERLGEKIKTFANLLLRSTDDEASFSELVAENGFDAISYLSKMGVISDTQFATALDSKGHLTDRACAGLKGVLYQSIFTGASTQTEEYFYKMPTKAQRAILATAFRDYDSAYKDRMIKEIQQSIIAYNALMADDTFSAAKNIKDVKLAVQVWKQQYALDDVSGEPYLPAKKFSNFALELAAMYKGHTQSFIQSTFNQMYDFIQGKQEETLLTMMNGEEVDKTPRSLAEAIEQVLRIEYQPIIEKESTDGSNRDAVLDSNSEKSEGGRPGSSGAVDSRERTPEGAESADSGAGVEDGSAAAGGRGNIQPADERQTDLQPSEKINANLSEEEKDEYGKPLVLAKDGTTTFGIIDAETGLTEAPIRLSLGENTTDDEGTNHGYGLLHIEAGHGDQIRNAGYASVEEFVEEVAKNYTDIREGALIGENQTYLLEVSDDHNNTLFIQLSKDGTYWNVNSAGIFKKKYSRRKPKVYSVPAVGEGTNTDTSEVNSGQTEGATAPAGNSSQTSDRKDTKSLTDEQISSSTSSEAARPMTGEESSVQSSDDKGVEQERPSVQAAVDAASAEVNISPTPAQAEAGNYKKGHIVIGDFDITIENPAGSTRKGVDADSKEWQTTMANAYGYIKGTESVDGDHIDVFLHTDMDEWNGRKVFVVDQTNDDGSFDEHKVMLGFNYKDKAMSAYLANYDATWAEKHPGLRISEVNIEDFNKWIQSSHRKTKPFADYSTVSKITDNAPTEAQKNDVPMSVSGAVKGNQPVYEAAKGMLEAAGIAVHEVSGVDSVLKDGEFALSSELGSVGRKGGGVRELRSADGVVYGWTVGGEVYLNRDAMNPETPVYEYAHLWDLMVQRENPELWSRGKELMRQTGLWDEVRDDPAYADIRDDEDAVVSEVHARLTGERGAEVLERMVEDARKDGALAVAEAVSLVSRLRQWLREMFEGLKKTLGKWNKRDLNELTAEQFADMTLRDLVDGINPNAEIRRGEQARIVTEANPMLDDYHRGVRKREDVMTFDEVLAEAEAAWDEYGDLTYPDMDIEMLRQAKRNGVITIYSSNPIETGVFVTPSRMNAEDYAGGGHVYEKQVSVNDVAWTGEDEGQFAPSASGDYHESDKSYESDKADTASEAADGVELIGWDEPGPAENPFLNVGADKSAAMTTPKSKRKWISDEDAAEFDDLRSGLRSHLGTDTPDLVQEESPEYGHKKSPANARQDLTTSSLHHSDAAKLRNISDNLRQLAEKYMGKTDKRGVFTDLARAIGATKLRNDSSSDYATITIPTGKTATIRISNHNAKAGTFAKRGEYADNVSIVIKSRKTSNTFEAHPEVELSEYVYTTEAIKKDGNMLPYIAESLRRMIETGEYVDLSGKAIVNHSPETNFAHEPSPAYGKPQPKQMDAESPYNSTENAIFADTYETQDGKTINYTSENPEAYGGLFDFDFSGDSESSQSDNLRARPKRVQRETNPLLRRYGNRLKKQEGEFCHVERVFTESRRFDFTTGNEINGPEDVAFIFSQLENASAEHSYTVFVKNGEPTVVELCMGVYTATMVNTPAIIEAYRRIKPDTVYFVHNHPSGNLIYSKPDIDTLRVIEKALGCKVEGLIVNLRTGKFGTFDTIGNSDTKDKRTPSEVKPLTTYTFDQQVFADDYDPSALETIRSSRDVAAFIQSHRLGGRDKISLLVANQGNKVVANVHTPYTSLTDKKLVNAIIHNINTFGGMSVFVYGNGISSDGFYELQKRVKEASGNVFQVMDAVRIEGLHTGEYKSAGDGYVFEPDIPSQQRKADYVRELADKLNLDNVDIVEDASTLKGKRAKAKGFYTRSTGRITVVLSNHQTAEDVERTLLHEAVAHFGLRRMFGKEFNTFLDNVYDSSTRGIREKIAALAAANGWDFHTATEEYLASLAEETNFEEARKEAGWWSNVKRLFKEMLSAIGLEGFANNKVKIGDNELRYILWASYQNLKGKNSGVLGVSADIVKQQDLKVGEFEAEKRPTSYEDEQRNMEAVSKQFDEDLSKYEDGLLPEKYRFDLGMPSLTLLSAGFPHLPISMRRQLLEAKSSMKRHPFEANELKGLAKALSNPLAVLRYSKENMRNVIVDIAKGDKHFLVGVTLNYMAGDIEINSVSGLFPKEDMEWLKAIQRGDAIYIDKKKIRQIIDSQRTTNTVESARIGLDLNSVAKIVENFENPAIPAYERSVEDDDLFRDGDFSSRDKAIARSAYNRMCESDSFQFREAMQDSMLGLKALYQAVLGKKTKIEEVAGFENAYLYENRMNSTNKSQQFEYFLKYMKPLIKAIGALTGESSAERDKLTEYMMAKHGLERNEYMRNEAAANGEETERDFAGLCGLTGITDWNVAEFEARQIVNDYESTHNIALIDKLWEMTNAATKASLEKIYVSGILSTEAYEKIRDMYEYYIPLRGWDETTSEEVYGYLTSQGGPLMGNIMKSAHGRSSKADDPIATIGMMADAAIRQGNRNIMKQRFLNFVLNHPSDAVSIKDLWFAYDEVSNSWKPQFADVTPDMSAEEVESEVEKFESKIKALAQAKPDKYKRGREAAHIPYKIVKGNLREHQVLIKRGGRTYVVTINGNPRAAQALNGLTNPDVERNDAIGNLLKFGERVNRQLSAFYTTRNPEFVVSNFLRDMLYSNCMTWVKENPRYALRFHKNFGRVNPIIMRRLLGKWSNGELNMGNAMEKAFYDFMINGGETGYTSVKDIEGHKKIVSQELKKQGSAGRQAWHALGMQLELLNRSAENCARFAAFLTSRQFGRSIDRAIYDAKEVSVNFNKKGSGGKMVNAIGQNWAGKLGSYLGGLGRVGFVFWGAGIQGMTNFGRNAKNNPLKFTAGAAAVLSLGCVIPMLAQMLGGGDGDDDDKNAYYNLPEYIRRSSICFKAGNQWISIPLPIEFRSIYGLGELTYGVVSGNERYSDNELAFHMASQVSQILPLDMLEGGGGVHAFIPSAAKPFTEAYIMNEGWTGMPVYKDTPYNRTDPEWTKAYQSADQHLVAFTRWLNEVSGGDDFKKGTIDINPSKIEYLLNGTFGGMFTFPNKFKKSAETAFGDREFEWRNVPIANRVIKSGDERTANRKLQNEYFKYKDEYEATGKLARKYEDATDDGIMGYAEKVDFLYNSAEYLRYEIFDEFKPEIDAYREEIAAETDPAVRKEIEAEMWQMMRELINALHDPDKYFREAENDK